MARCYFIFLILTQILCSCSALHDENGHVYNIPVLTSQGPKFENVELKTLHTQTSLDGDVASVIMQGLFTDDGLRGTSHMRLIKANGVWFPADPMSGQGLSTYALMENMYFAEKNWGVAQYLQWPRPMMGVGFDFASTVQPEFGSYAAYYPSLDSVVVFRYEGSGVPMAMDPTILAHEHGHEYIEHLFIRPFMSYFPKYKYEDIFKAFETDSSLDHVTYTFGLMNSWNEGLADFLAYTHTGDTRLGRWSLPEKISKDRELAVDNVTFFEEKLFMAETTHEKLTRPPASCPRICMRYVLGTQLARWLYRLSRDQGSPQNFQAFIFKHLPLIAQQLAAKVIASTDRHSHLNIGNEYFLIELMTQKAKEQGSLSYSECNTLKGALVRDSFNSRFLEVCRHATYGL
jgi:hypothetical protein